MLAGSCSYRLKWCKVLSFHRSAFLIVFEVKRLYQVDNGQRLVVSGWRLVVCYWSIVRCYVLMVSGRWLALSGERLVVSG